MDFLLDDECMILKKERFGPCSVIGKRRGLIQNECFFIDKRSKMHFYQKVNMLNFSLI